MAMSFQEQSRRRKLIYVVLCILLLSGMVWHRRFVEASAVRNDLEETDLGEVDLGGSTARFALVSLRGPLICGLWWEAIERQKKHEWNQLELLIKSLTKLQPHFRKPWTFQAWNLAYNVSVEFDRIEDKYTYIAEGIQWLVEGEKKNRAKVYVEDEETGEGRKIERGDPNMRWEIGHMQQNKITVSDEKATHACLFQLSCIHPDRRDPARLRQNPQLLADFKKSYPRLVRRIRALRHVPEGVESLLDNELLTFLETYRRVPYHDPSQLAPAGAPGAARPITAFPIWPELKKPGNPELEAVQDACEVARHWYDYSQEPLPPPDPVPGPAKELQRTDRIYRLPESMSIFIFRAKPAQTKSHHADLLAKEGWFEQSKQSWQEAYRLWREYARENGLDLGPERTAELERKARVYRDKYPEHAEKGLGPTPKMLEEQDIRESMQAAEQLEWRDRNRSLGNFDHWDIRSEMERRDETVQARNHYYNAANRWRSDLLLAKAEYEKGFDLWRKLSTFTPPFFLLDLGATHGLPIAHTFQTNRFYYMTPFGRDKQIQEEIVEIQDEYQWIRAKSDSAGVLQSGFVSWELGRLLGGQAIVPGVQVTGVATLPTFPPTLSLEAIEFHLASLPGPLDFYLDQSIRKQLEKKRVPKPEGTQEQQQAEAQPGAEKAGSPSPKK